ncbi:MAG: hypothetical protein AB8B73_11400 [Ekhidna sp.]
MKLLIRLIAIGVLTYFISPLSFWWIAMIISFAVCYVSPSSGLNAFVAGFLGVGLVWIGQSWRMDVANESNFSNVIVELFPINESFYLILVTGLVGGLAGGFSALSGTSFRQLFLKEKKRSLYN